MRWLDLVKPLSACSDVLDFAIYISVLEFGTLSPKGAFLICHL